MLPAITAPSLRRRMEALDMRNRYGRLVATLTPIGTALALLMAAGTSDRLDASGGFDWSPPLNIGAEVNSGSKTRLPTSRATGWPSFSSTRTESPRVSRILGLEEAERHSPWGPREQSERRSTSRQKRSPARSRKRSLLSSPRRQGGWARRLWCRAHSIRPTTVGWRSGKWVRHHTAATSGPSLDGARPDPQLSWIARAGRFLEARHRRRLVPGGWAGPRRSAASELRRRSDPAAAAMVRDHLASGRPGARGLRPLSRRRKSVQEPGRHRCAWAAGQHQVRRASVAVGGRGHEVFQSTRPGRVGGRVST